MKKILLLLCLSAILSGCTLNIELLPNKEHDCTKSYSVLAECYIDEEGRLHSSGICDKCGSYLSFVDGELVED